MAFTTHDSIIDGVREQDEESWQRFVAFYTPAIRLAGRDFRVPEMYLDDLVQNVLMMISTRLIFQFDSSKGRFRYFLRGIVRNKAREMIRNLMRQKVMRAELTYLHDDCCCPDLYSQEWKNYIHQQIRDVLRANLSPAHFQIFEFLYLKNWPVSRVAEYLDLPQSTVYFARKTILKQCRIVRWMIFQDIGDAAPDKKFDHHS